MRGLEVIEGYRQMKQWDQAVCGDDEDGASRYERGESYLTG
jgi:hypothetical protein